jgi:hypothetical protein
MTPPAARRVALAATLVVLTGCAAPDTTSSTPGARTASPVGPSPSVASSPAVAATLVRTGGQLGVNDVVVVDAQGHWTDTDQDGKQRSGQLTPQQQNELTELTKSPAFASEAARPTTAPLCMDAYIYTITAGRAVVSYVDCPDDTTRPPTAMAITKLLTGAVLR